jgi:hypothetical protein
MPPKRERSSPLGTANHRTNKSAPPYAGLTVRRGSPFHPSPPAKQIVLSGKQIKRPPIRGGLFDRCSITTDGDDAAIHNDDLGLATIHNDDLCRRDDPNHGRLLLEQANYRNR